MMDFNSSKAKRQAFSAALGGVLDAEMTRKQSLQPRRQYVGASAIAGPCARAIQFEFAGAPREREFSPETLRKFAFGHLSEEWCRFEFKDAGFTLEQKDPKTGVLIAFSQLDGQFRGHPDGVFLAGPDDIEGVGYPCLWEHKGVGHKTYASIEREGLKKSKPTYYGQVVIQQAYLDLADHPAIFSVTNLDSGEQMHLLVPFDAEEAQRLSDRAEAIVGNTRDGVLLPRPFQAADHYICRMCDFATRCWGLPS
jgi:hypothetical protein